MFEVKASVKGYEVISTGEIHAVECPIDFVVAGLKFRIAFKDDFSSPTSRYVSEIIDQTLVLNLYNFNNSLGEGVLEPLIIATTNGRDIALTFYVFSIPSPLGVGRRFSYAFLLGGKKDG
ncbi:hypothetical protein HU732_09930 [Pseudomonas proteolytica]|uniref:DUF6864 domain-containing function n=1 Tax=Pseudomonas proteolytica TaxID=219574 RepID=UPI001648372A|nr:hypothetical protein [Pseudomonas proteolytica]MBC3336611.1 hypothetical protein [Pseudomonas proteolytica]